jgi:2-polyprenyl-3-methyl-5-hydroxy-6-metoxy-1,4-benzoquinol methylase
MFEKIDRCPLCSKEAIVNHLICTDYQVTGESFAITKCVQCGFLFTNPRPTATSIQKYYDSPEYISHSDAVHSLKDRIYRIVRTYNTKAKLHIIHGLGTGTTLLDYGCGTGNFLHACKNEGWTVDGLEPNPIARQKSADLLQQHIFANHTEIENKRWDLITLWHVLEHIHELNATIAWLKKSLFKNGRLILALPNANSPDAKHYKEKWAGYDVPRHLYHFTPETTKDLLHRHDLKIKKILPMHFDAYYVSLLSEKGQNTLLNYLRGFLYGYKSNAYAKKHPLSYSSLIYIAGK